MKGKKNKVEELLRQGERERTRYTMGMKRREG
jgi:hypothetical protein